MAVNACFVATGINEHQICIFNTSLTKQEPLQLELDNYMKDEYYVCRLLMYIVYMYA